MTQETTERKSAIVTGSATGVGAATALALARRSYNVVINFTKSEREAKEAAAAGRDAGADTLLLRADVAEDADGRCGHRDMGPARCAREQCPDLDLHS